jgi:aminoglycoside 2'-N-acetyltransferase I
MTSPPARAGLRIEIVPRAALPAAHLDAVAALCERAYEEDLRAGLAALPDATHVLGWDRDASAEALVSHLCWVPRTLGYLPSGGGPPARWPAGGLAPSAPEAAGAVALRAAYVELVATEPACQGRGHATALLRAAAAAVAADPAGYALGALAPSDPAFYARVGWEAWRGPLFAAGPDGRVAPTPEEEVMVLRLPATHAAAGPLDVARPLVAPWREGDLW